MRFVLAALLVSAFLGACGGEPEEQADGRDQASIFDPLDDGSVCAWDWQCHTERGMTCRPVIFSETGVTKKCLPKGGQGVPCDGGDPDDCQDGMLCWISDFFQKVGCCGTVHDRCTLDI